MLRLTDKHNCCGCEACVQRCPCHCITMQQDIEGFLYPQIDLTHCIECGLCEKTCPIINLPSSQRCKQVLAAKAKDKDILMKSSSGGIFSLVAEYILQQNGIVFGAKFNETWEVVHDYTETSDNINEFRRSKYVQSRIGESFKKAEKFLKSGRLVLFTGTPCQINGLKLYLKKEYENLYTISIACHGVPSPKIWKLYLNEIITTNPNMRISSINFREKTNGWINYKFKLELHSVFNNQQICIQMDYHDNIFMKAFLQNLILRPSCEDCKIKVYKNLSDITIGDLWGVSETYPELDSELGISFLLINTNKGELLLNKLDIEKHTIDLNKIRIYNGGLLNNFRPHKDREVYFKNISKMKKFSCYTNRFVQVTFLTKLKNKFRYYIKK